MHTHSVRHDTGRIRRVRIGDSNLSLDGEQLVKHLLDTLFSCGSRIVVREKHQAAEPVLAGGGVTDCTIPSLQKIPRSKETKYDHPVRGERLCTRWSGVGQLDRADDLVWILQMRKGFAVRVMAVFGEPG